jgi:ABC-type glycerol-3-phosphate transport system permease component
VSVWQLIVTRTFFQTTIPHELLECSRIDGASDLRFFGQIVLPLSKPIIAVNLLLYGVATWTA